MAVKPGPCAPSTHAVSAPEQQDGQTDNSLWWLSSLVPCFLHGNVWWVLLFPDTKHLTTSPQCGLPNFLSEPFPSVTSVGSPSWTWPMPQQTLQWNCSTGRHTYGSVGQTLSLFSSQQLQITIETEVLAASFSLRELTCMHWVYLALWTCKVLCGSFLCAIYKFSFIHS